MNGLCFAEAVIEAADLAPITSAISDNLDVLLPVGLGILALMLGVALIPRIIYKFF